MGIGTFIATDRIAACTHKDFRSVILAFTATFTQSRNFITRTHIRTYARPPIGRCGEAAAADGAIHSSSEKRDVAGGTQCRHAADAQYADV